MSLFYTAAPSISQQIEQQKVSQNMNDDIGISSACK
jgi:hypothetical protein